MEFEGYVVRDANFNRIKLKSPQYVALAHLKDGFGPKRLIEIVRNNTAEEFLSYFPEWTEDYNKTKIKYDTLIANLIYDYCKYHSIESQKDFAIAIKGVNNFTSALFECRKSQKNNLDNLETFFKQYIKEMNINNLQNYF